MGGKNLLRLSIGFAKCETSYDTKTNSVVLFFAESLVQMGLAHFHEMDAIQLDIGCCFTGCDELASFVSLVVFLNHRQLS
jgi:hypothetical protein